MTHKKFVLFCISCLVLFSSCGLQETVVQKEQISYFSFIGNISGAIVHIDDLEPIVLKKSEKDSKNIHYKISAGKHHVVILKDGKEVVNRIVLLGSGSVKEIEIP